MPIRPKQVTLTNSSVDILNAIRNSATTNYRDYVPVATADADSVREIGAVIMNYPALQNEFLSALINRIASVLVTSKMYENPWQMFKRGELQFGETVEEIFVNIAKAQTYDATVSESKVFERVIPDVRSAFHTMNYQKFYKVTIQNEQLRMAFLSWDGITDLIARIVDTLYTGANYDEFQVMKYMLAKRIINGMVKGADIPELTSANMKQVVSAIKTMSNKLTFMSGEYNLAGVKTHSRKDEQFIILNSQFDASMDVEVLASAFNMDKAQFIGQRVLVDGFGDLDIERLNELFMVNGVAQNGYVEFSQDELDALNKIPAIIVDKDFFMIFDRLAQFTEIYNGEGLYWNYWYHTWKTFSVSPFANAVIFIPQVDGETAQTVVSVSISPEDATANSGQQVQFMADVETTGFASKVVNWSVGGLDTTGITIDNSGLLTISKDVVGEKLVTVSCTSAVDGEKSASTSLYINYTV